MDLSGTVIVGFRWQFSWQITELLNLDRYSRITMNHPHIQLRFPRPDEHAQLRFRRHGLQVIPCFDTTLVELRHLLR